ncbi:MAG TPA: undecaprenyl-diphosphate phosphatase, partial [bacterium]|nr:undecaprenyl-diphosphate phosphatase [bacterium]
MTVWDGVILGIVQGITEFLPVSSSGHLVLGCGFLGLGCGSLNFDVVVHIGSLAAVLLVYRRLLGRLLLSAFRGRIRLHRG